MANIAQLLKSARSRNYGKLEGWKKQGILEKIGMMERWKVGIVESCGNKQGMEDKTESGGKNRNIGMMERWKVGIVESCENKQGMGEFGENGKMKKVWNFGMWEYWNNGKME